MSLDLRTLWMRFHGNGQRRLGQRHPFAPFRPRLENLEDRTLLAQDSFALPAVALPALVESSLIGVLAQPRAAAILGEASTSRLFSADASWKPDSGWAILGGAGVFRAVGPAGTLDSMLIALGDMNGDDRPDQLVSFPGASYLVLSNADGAPATIVGLPTPYQSQVFLITIGDFNADQRNDLALVSRSTAPRSADINLQVFLGKGDGTFSSHVQLKAGPGIMAVTVGTFQSSSSLTVGDLNGDSSIDVMLTRSTDSGSKVQLLFGTADHSFVPRDIAVEPGPFSIEIDTPSDDGITPVHAVTPEVPTDGGGSSIKVPPISRPPTGPAPTTGSDDDEALAVPPPPVELHTSLAASGLSVQVLVDPVVISNIPPGEALSLEALIWRQVISEDQKPVVPEILGRPAASPQESHPSNNPPTESAPKAPAPAGNPGAPAARPAPSSRTGELADSLAEEIHEKLLPGEQRNPTDAGSHSAAAAPPAPVGVAGGSGPLPDKLAVPGETSYLGIVVAKSPCAGGLGLDEDPFGTLYLRFEPLLTTGRGKSAKEGVSALEMGKVLLEAMIIVKMSPGGSGPQPNSTPGLVNSTDSLMRVAEIVKESSQFLARLVRGFYQRYLGRDPENGEDSGWINMLLGGDKEENVLSAFLTTREFSERAESLVAAGTPDQRFLTALYQLVLDRPVAPAELETWLQGTTSLDREQASLALVRSTEFRSQRIGELFSEVLQREPTASELAAWANTPFDLLSVRNLIRSNPEWFA